MKKPMPKKMPAKMGGKDSKAMKMTAGAASGEGRLQKAGIKLPKKK